MHFDRIWRYHCPRLVYSFKYTVDKSTWCRHLTDTFYIIYIGTQQQKGVKHHPPLLLHQEKNTLLLQATVWMFWTPCNRIPLCYILPSSHTIVDHQFARARLRRQQGEAWYDCPFVNKPISVWWWNLEKEGRHLPAPSFLLILMRFSHLD